MNRINPVTPDQAGPFTKLVFKIAERQSGGKLPEPVAVYANRPLLMNGYSAFEMAFQYSRKAPPKLKLLAEMKAAAIVGCEWCLDFGSWLSREGGITERQLRELHEYRDSDAFTDDEKLVVEYAEAITRTPAEIPDELLGRMRARFDDAQIMELATAAAIENFRSRLNLALGIGPQDYSEGAFCMRPEATAAAEAA